MKFTLPLFGIEIQASLDIVRRHRLHPSDQALKDALGRAIDETWSELLLTWRMAPEFIDNQKDLRPCLRLALTGSARAITMGKENPLAHLDDRHSKWSWLAREVTSPQAMSPESPFHKARLALAPNIGSHSSCLDQGDFEPGTQMLLAKIHPQFYAKAAESLARRLDEVEIAAGAKLAPPSLRPRSL